MAPVGVCKPRIQPWRTLGQALPKPASCLGQYAIIYMVLHTPLPAGLQTYLYLPQLGRERGQGNEIRQHLYTWHDSGHSSLLSLHSYAGVYGNKLLFLGAEHPASFVFCFCHHQCSVGLTPWQTQNGSMRVSWISWMIPMRKRRLLICWTGGIGKYSSIYAYHAALPAKADALIFIVRCFPAT